MVFKKNEINIMVKNVLDVIFGGFFYWIFGFVFSWGELDDEYGKYNVFLGLVNFFVDVSWLRMGGVFVLYFF